MTLVPEMCDVEIEDELQNTIERSDHKKLQWTLGNPLEMYAGIRTCI